jgi:hypothetical protein
MIYKPTTLATILFAGLLAVAQLLAQSSGPTTFTGIVSDSMCGTHHMTKDKTPAECTRICIKQRMKHALVAGDKVYTLEGHEPELDKLAGQRVTVAGKLTGDILAVSYTGEEKQRELTRS